MNFTLLNERKMKYVVVIFTLVLYGQCLVTNVKRDLGPKNTLATTAAFAGDAAIAGAAYSSGAGALATAIYAGYTLFTYSVFLFVRPETRWTESERAYRGHGMLIRLSPDGEAVIESDEPLDLCRYRPQCRYGYGISEEGRLFFDVSMFEPEGWSGSFEITESQIHWWRNEDDTRVLKRANVIRARVRRDSFASLHNRTPNSAKPRKIKVNPHFNRAGSSSISEKRSNNTRNATSASRRARPAPAQ